MLAFRKVTYFTPPPRTLMIFDQADIEIKKGRNTVIAGGNGSGKTTMVELLLKITHPSSGTVVGGWDRAVGVFEDFEEQLFFSTVYEEVASGTNISGNKFALADRFLGLGELMKRSTFELSYTQKARLVFAVSYFTEREYILIDCIPEDIKINRMIEYISENENKTFVMFLPSGESRSICAGWDSYKIKNKKIVKNEINQCKCK